MDVSSQIKEILVKDENELVQTRRYLHQHPELSFQEFETANFIENSLHKLELCPKRLGGTGVIADIEGVLPGKTVALRADIDALPMEELNDIEYRSLNEGVMHACGHDGHVAILLAVAKALCQLKENLPGKVRLIFQPAEEVPPGGAKTLIEQGVLDGVDVIFGLHLSNSFNLGEVAVCPGPVKAAADRFKITVTGVGGHGGRPHETIDALVTGCQLVNCLQTIISRQVDPIQAGVLTIGTFNSGSNFNVVAERAELTGTVRALDNYVRDLIENKIKEITKGICEVNGASFQIDYLRGYPVLINEPATTAEVSAVLGQIVDDGNVINCQPVMAGEDFAYYLQKVPGCYFYIGAKEPGQTFYPNHNPRFNFSEKALALAAEAYLNLLFKNSLQN